MMELRIVICNHLSHVRIIGKCQHETSETILRMIVLMLGLVSEALSGLNDATVYTGDVNSI